MTNGINKLILKEIKMSTLPPATSEDTGFCSGEDYMESEIHSPTDSSEDSVEVKVSTISFNNNKRKLLDDTPTKADIFTGPLKKRMCLKVKAESVEASTPFRPWNPPRTKSSVNVFSDVSKNNNYPVSLIKSEPISPPVTKSSDNFSYFRPPSPVRQPQSEPVSLVVKRENNDSAITKPHTFVNPNDIRVPIHPQIAKLSTIETERMILKTNEHFPSLKVRTNLTQATAHVNNQFKPSAHQNQPNSRAQQSTSAAKKAEQRREQRNYKNMTRERRIEANARERTRVHTISAAFDTLRQAVPAYSHNQKLSKLSVLRIACSYIMTLSSVLAEDSEGSQEPSVSECVDMVSKTIQREGKLRKKKDDLDND